MKDILGRTIQVGDIVAHGTRSGNSGDLNVKIVSEIKDNQAKVVNYYRVTCEYDKDNRKWRDVTPYYKKSGSGWTSMNLLVVNESIPTDLSNFLRSILQEIICQKINL